MSHIGMRIELSNRIHNIKTLDIKYNELSNNTKIFDVHDNGRITVEKVNEMIIARGRQDNKINTGLINFSLMTKLDVDNVEIERLVKIVNVLGNDRLIRESVKTFVFGQSALNKISEFNNLVQSFKDIDTIVPGFINIAWYYAPEIKIV